MITQVRYLLIIVFFAIKGYCPNEVLGQQISGPEDVLNALESGLFQFDQRSYQAFRLYSQSAQRLTERGNYFIADSLFQLAMPLAHLEKDSTRLMEIYASRAFMYKVQGRFTKSLEDYLMVLDYYTRKRDIDKLVLAHAYLAEYYRSIEDGPLCGQYVYEGLELLQDHNIQPKNKAYLYGRAAAFQSQFRANTDSTIHYSNLALAAGIEANNKFCIGLSQNELGFIYMNIDKADTVKNFGYFRSAMNNFLAEKRYRDYLSAMENVARNYYNIGMPQMAIDTEAIAISIAEANQWYSFLDDAYLLMANAHFSLGHAEQYRVYFDKAYYTRIGTLNAEHAIEASELTANYQRNIAQQKLLEQETQTQLAKEEASNNRRALIITIVLAVVLLAIAVISVQLFVRFRRKNVQLREQQKIIKETNAQLSDALDQKTVLYRELNHRVKNNLTVLSGLIYLQESSETDSSPKDVYETLRQRIQSMAMVHQNLYEFNEALNINFQEYLGQLVPNVASAYTIHKEVSHDIRCEGLIVDINEAVPLAMIINELITNSFKHAFDNVKLGEIEIWSETKPSRRTIHYKDNGPGIQNTSGDETTMSLGLKLIHLMVKQLKGELIYKGDGGGVYYQMELTDPA